MEVVVGTSSSILPSVKTRDDKDDIFQAKVVKDLRYRLQFPLVRPKVKAFIG